MTGAGCTLRELLAAGVGHRLLGAADTRVTDVRHDSRAVQPGDLFVVLRGARFDGRRFVPQARERGARALLLREPMPEVDLPQLLADEPRRAMGRAAHRVHGDPTASLRVVAVTGTNGKTSVAWLLEQALRASGARPALMGTVTVRGPQGERAASLTTPESDEVARFAAEALRSGATHLVMEASSHALQLGRLEGTRIEVAAFTGLGRDHLDFHGSMAAYREAKARLFVEHRPATAVVRVDDSFGAELAERARARRVIRVAALPGFDADLQVREARIGRDGIEATVRTPRGEGRLRSTMTGAHNLDNLLVALGCGLALGVPLEAMLQGLAAAGAPPGRLQPVLPGHDPAVYVDYAHTPDALARVLAALREVTPGRLIVVFGCGGERDQGKRAPMGEAAARGADLVVLTNDNPRGEPPERIAEQVERGLQVAGRAAVAEEALRAAGGQGYVVQLDRARAIELALRAARPGDAVLLAGKGHERVQWLGERAVPFDDVAVARAVLERLGREEEGVS